MTRFPEIFKKTSVVLVATALFFAGAWVRSKTGDLSSLIGIWEGFTQLNPEKFPNSFYVHKQGGYDGQFFFLISQGISQGKTSDLVLDSYNFRMHRIGFPLLMSPFFKIFGPDSYPIFALYLLWGFTILAFWQLYSFSSNKTIVILFLFNPFCWNANLLLVADGLFTSFAILTLVHTWKLEWKRGVVFAGLAFLTRELGILLLPGLLYYSWGRNRKAFWGFLFFGALAIGYFIYLRSILPIHPGTNPLGFFDMIDYPLFGFFKSFFSGNELVFPLKEIPKLLHFSLLFLLVCGIIRSRWPYFLFLPLAISLIIPLIGVEGYWRSYDNISRMFALPYALVILSNNSNVFLRVVHYLVILLFVLFLYRTFLLV